jgi:hypothetical protein
MSHPFSDLLDSILKDPQYLKNIEYGEPRSGHPEGKVKAHINELHNNLMDMCSQVSTEEYMKLLILIHVHDTFKAESKRDCPITDPQSHASLAAKFLADKGGDADLVAMVQWHDEGYACWKKAQAGKSSVERIQRLIEAVKDWNLFSAFMIIDGCTAGKSRDKLEWFFDQVAGRVESKFGKDQILR